MQLPLFDPPAQKRARTMESLELYFAVLVLRKRGRKVYRSGLRMHSVDGNLLSGKQLRWVARAARGGK
jgi:hypothetical protein